MCLYSQHTSGQPRKGTLSSDAHGLQILIPISEWLAGESGGFTRQLQRKWGRGTLSLAIWGPVSLCGSRKASKIYLIIIFPKSGPAL